MVKQKNKIVFNKSFYNTPAIEDALDAFRDICTGELQDKEAQITVILTPKSNNNPDELKNEFCNYVLALMKNKSLM